MFTLLSCLLACAPAWSAGPLPAAQLVARVHDLPGFAGARVHLSSTRSAFTWAHQGQGTWTQDEVQTSTLRTLGFEQGVEAFFTATAREAHGHHREAVSEALVFPTASSAESALKASVPEALSVYGKQGMREFPGPAIIPGSISLDAFSPGVRGRAGNVFFSTGRCFFVVGDFVYSATTRAQADRAPLAGALALYRRDRRLCS
jgi:hypothetical protein